MEARSATVVRRSLIARTLAVGWLLIWVGILVAEPSARNAAGVGIAVLIAIGIWRGLLVLRGATIEKRGVFRWERCPTDLRQLTKVYLGRRLVGLTYPMVLELWISGGRRFSWQPRSSAQFSLTCWTWSRSWKAVAHQVSHYADALEAEMDGETRRLIACGRMPCDVATRVAEVVAGHPVLASVPPDSRDPSLTESLVTIALAAPVGFAFTVFAAWFKSDLGFGELWPAGLGGAGLFVAVCALMQLWDGARTS